MHKNENQCLRKVVFFSESKAISRASEITASGTPMRHYRCPNCHQFHLSRIRDSKGQVIPAAVPKVPLKIFNATFDSVWLRGAATVIASSKTKGKELLIQKFEEKGIGDMVIGMRLKESPSTALSDIFEPRVENMKIDVLDVSGNPIIKSNETKDEQP